MRGVFSVAGHVSRSILQWGFDRPIVRVEFVVERDDHFEVTQFWSGVPNAATAGM